MKDLPINLRIRLEQLMVELASAQTMEGFMKCRQKARELKHDIEACYEAQS